MFLLCTAAEGGAFGGDFPMKFVKDFFSNLGNGYRIGFCTEAGGLEDLAGAVKKAYHASISCAVGEISTLDFSETGLDQFLCPNAQTPWCRGYYQSLLEKLGSAGDDAEALLHTLDTYVKCCGDIALTAKLLFQHGNTVRYRLQKVRRAWGIRDGLSFEGQVVVFCRLRRIYGILDA